MKNNRQFLFLLIKWVRLVKGLNLMNVPRIMKAIKA